MTAKFELICDSIDGEHDAKELGDEDRDELVKVLYAQTMYLENHLFGKTDDGSNEKTISAKTRVANILKESKDAQKGQEELLETGKQTWKAYKRGKRQLYAQPSIEMYLYQKQKENISDQHALKSMSNKKGSEDSIYSLSVYSPSMKTNKAKVKVSQLTFGDLKSIENTKPSKLSNFAKSQSARNSKFEICERLNAFDALRFGL